MRFIPYSFSMLACSMLSLHAASPIKEYIVKEDVYQIVAESPTVSVLKWTSDTLPASKIKSLVAYCSSIGGNSIMVEESAKKNLFGDIYYEMSCKAPNAQGFVLNKKENLYFLKHESAQDLGYAMKGYIADEKLGEKQSPKELYSSMLNFGTNFYDFYGYCVAKGGEYLISNATTGNKAVKVNDYIVKGIGMRDLSVKEAGKHWCIDTKNPADAFTLTLSPHPYNGVMRFQVSKEGVDKSEIVMDDGANPTYLMSRSESSTILQNTLQPTNQVMMSKQPSSIETALAQKVIQTKSTQLGRGNGYMVEGIYLGTSSSGKDLAAVIKTADIPINSKTIYGKNWNPQWVMNFTDMSNGQRPPLYTGESMEKSFPHAITNEYKRVLDMCKIKGLSGSSYLGYDISCQRQGSMAQPIYEMTILKKDLLVLRDYEQ